MSKRHSTKRNESSDNDPNTKEPRQPPSFRSGDLLQFRALPTISSQLKGAAAVVLEKTPELHTCTVAATP